MLATGQVIVSYKPEWVVKIISVNKRINVRIVQVLSLSFQRLSSSC